MKKAGSIDEICDNVEDSAFLCKLSRLQAIAVCRAGHLVDYEPGNLLFKVGDIVSDIFIVTRGLVNLYQYTKEDFSTFDQLMRRRPIFKFKESQSNNLASTRSQARSFLMGCPSFEGCLQIQSLGCKVWKESILKIDTSGDIQCTEPDTIESENVHSIQRCCVVTISESAPDAY
jgi:hypothetical protein